MVDLVIQNYQLKINQKLKNMLMEQKDGKQ